MYSQTHLLYIYIYFEIEITQSTVFQITQKCCVSNNSEILIRNNKHITVPSVLYIFWFLTVFTVLLIIIILLAHST